MTSTPSMVASAAADDVPKFYLFYRICSSLKAKVKCYAQSFHAIGDALTVALCAVFQRTLSGYACSSRHLDLWQISRSCAFLRAEQPSIIEPVVPMLQVAMASSQS